MKFSKNLWKNLLRRGKREEGRGKREKGRGKNSCIILNYARLFIISKKKHELTAFGERPPPQKRERKGPVSTDV